MNLPAKNYSKVAFCILTHLFILSSDLFVMVMFAYFLGYVFAILIGKKNDDLSELTVLSILYHKHPSTKI